MTGITRDQKGRVSREIGAWKSGLFGHRQGEFEGRALAAGAHGGGLFIKLEQALDLFRQRPGPLPERLIGFLALGDVNGVSDEMLRFAVFISEQRAGYLAPNDMSLLVAVTSFVTVGRDFAIQNLLP